MSDKGKLARENFNSGCNCAQSVAVTFCEECGFDRETMMKLSCSFGAGMGRLREVCGAVSGMLLVAGMLYASDDTTDDDAKAQHYERVQELAFKFKEKHGTFICRELLGLDIDGADDPTPSKRTEEYYQTRPCGDFIEDGANILMDYINKHPYK